MTRRPATLLQRLQTTTDAEAWARFVELDTPLLLSWARQLGLSAEAVRAAKYRVLNRLRRELTGLLG